MTILSNLLPGLRELRAPLAAGYLWLAALALAISGPESAAVPKSLQKTVTDAYAAAGPGGRIAALTFVAYLIGIVSTTVSSIVGQGRHRTAAPLYDFARSLSREFLARVSRPLRASEIYRLGQAALGTAPRTPSVYVSLLALEPFRRAEEQGLARIQVLEGMLAEYESRHRQATQLLTAGAQPAAKARAVGLIRDLEENQQVIQHQLEEAKGDFHEETRPALEWELELAESVRAAIEAGLDRTLLQLRMSRKHTAAWSAIDRDRSEADFRWGVAAPILALAVVLAWRLDAGLGVYTIIAVPAVFFMGRWAIRGESRISFGEPRNQSRTRRWFRTVTDAVPFKIRRYRAVLLALAWLAAAILVPISTAPHGLLVTAVGVVGGLAPPALWGVGAASYERALALFVDAIAISGLEIPVTTALNRALEDLPPF